MISLVIVFQLFVDETEIFRDFGADGVDDGVMIRRRRVMVHVGVYVDFGTLYAIPLVIDLRHDFDTNFHIAMNQFRVRGEQLY